MAKHRTIMISGVHAIGKTTTAKEIAHKTDSLLVGSVAALIAERLKYKIDNNPARIDTAKYQQEILNALEIVYEATAGNPRVFDRSPLDSAVYLTLAIQDDLALSSSILTRYTNRCIDLTYKYCDVLIVPEAYLSTPYEDKPGRPKFTEQQIQYRKQYAECLDLFVEAVSTSVKVIRVPVDKQYEKRIKFIMKELDK